MEFELERAHTGNRLGRRDSPRAESTLLNGLTVTCQVVVPSQYFVASPPPPASTELPSSPALLSRSALPE